MLDALHILLTYRCTLECDHCFVHAGPYAPGVMTLPRLRGLIEQASAMEGVRWVYFEGGEPLLLYPVLLRGLKLAKGLGLLTGLVTNAYGAVSDEDAEAWLTPLAEAGLSYLNISDDTFHYEEERNPARTALAAAARLGIPTDPIRIGRPRAEPEPGDDGRKGAPVVGGGPLFRGRAADKLTAGLPTRPWQEFTTCPYEELRRPERIHADPYGHLHLCQGLSLGNAWERPLAELVDGYDAARHPIAGPLAEGGPAELARRHGIHLETPCVDECHLCYLVRRALLERFPELLAPRQVYGP
ncbi:Coenzyme PQQ synthesis protein E [Fundidesulfovibrio magnetotacticus]|uniref:Coenzyme PQQ synthesis protein E n=1 Tax=Fundidesulfovibrio magnetotacticus TaxID=2730080 RepID=A0A6V8M258_9BACT|nr:radical SAM protein [Fundidesulfovibrio magnetotacticus]GFK95907.1 Coenzyme PQQ synthesis protein E [Fundidesulfovibrio magnetotacticus]